MKALCWHGTNDIRCDNVPDPKIEEARDVIIKVTSCAICGSDLHLMDGLMPTMKSGDILGHEFMGEVVETGSAHTKFRKGDRIVVPLTSIAAECRRCSSASFPFASAPIATRRSRPPVRLHDGRLWLLPPHRRLLGRPGRICARAEGRCRAHEVRDRRRTRKCSS